MFMVLKKKHMIITTLVIMLGVAGYLNYRYDKDNPKKVSEVETSNISEPDIGETVMVTSDNVEQDYFATDKIERDSARQKTKAELESLLESGDISEEVKEETRRRLADLALNSEKELTAENLLAAKGFNQTMVYITPDFVNVTVKQDALSRSDTAKIVDVIFELTQNNNIKIVEVE